MSLALMACATLPNYERPRVYLTHLQFQEASMLAQTFLLRLRIDNPNDTALPINGIDIELILNGHSLAQGLSNQFLAVPRFGSAEVEVRATTTLISLLQQVLFLQGQEKLSYKIAGRLHLARTLGFGQSDFPFQEKGVLDLATLQKRSTRLNAVPGGR
ncbi:LEA type 2 family protein [Nitrosococcus wardiae]|uniref:LEA type 2 family protein n=1 Tax=Nitrosococcus wardiae TaxID=1814290 RepID=UPI001F0DD66F|nr:LEA type 2 family protein [Nitrosococcus wardiae]